jgi:cytochrome c peroxidase
MKKPLFLLLATTVYTFLGVFQINRTGNPEKLLRQTLEELGGEKGLKTFVLPNSDDFQSIPQDSKNPITFEKIALGKLLFHETAMGTKPFLENGLLYKTYSCATCHTVSAGFQIGARQAIGDGGSGFGIKGELRTKHKDYRIREIDVQMRKTPTVLNSAYQKLMFWDGQFGATANNKNTQSEWKEGTPMNVNHLGFEGVESQAIAGMEVHRLSLGDGFFEEYPDYKPLFDKAFPEFTDTVKYSDRAAGLAMAAYERTLLANKAPFQRWLKGEKRAMSKNEKRGALLFFGKAGCSNCHSGPALNDQGFHALGMGELKGENTFRTRGFKNERLGRGGFTKKAEDMYKFKTPQLYNLADATHFGHGATFTSILEIIEYKNQAKTQSQEIHAAQLSNLFEPLSLTKQEKDYLVLFISTSLYDNQLVRYLPLKVPSGKPFPVSDLESIQTDKITDK